MNQYSIDASERRVRPLIHTSGGGHTLGCNHSDNDSNIIIIKNDLWWSSTYMYKYLARPTTTIDDDQSQITAHHTESSASCEYGIVSQRWRWENLLFLILIVWIMNESVAARKTEKYCLWIIVCTSTPFDREWLMCRCRRAACWTSGCARVSGLRFLVSVWVCACCCVARSSRCSPGDNGI